MGTKLVLNPSNVILDPKQPVGEIQFPVENPRVQNYLRESLRTLARNFKGDDATPFEKLPAKAREAYFLGAQEPITYQYGEYRYSDEFRGIGPWLEAMHKDEEKPRLQSEIESLFSLRDCPACQGARLRPESAPAPAPAPEKPAEAPAPAPAPEKPAHK